MFNYREIVPCNNRQNNAKDLSVDDLISMNQKLESKIAILYRMLGGDDSSLIRREKICEEKHKKALMYIAKLKKGKQDLLGISRDLYQKLDEAEEEREKLLSHIQNLELQVRDLEYENMKLRRELSEARHFINKMLTATSEDAVQQNYESSPNNVNIPNTSSNMTNTKKDDLSTEGIKKSIEQLTMQVENIQVYLKRLTDPITSSSVPSASNPYGEIDHFLD